jgi:hypothetical protein
MGARNASKLGSIGETHHRVMTLDNGYRGRAKKFNTLWSKLR